MEGFQLLGVYLRDSITSLFIWKLRHVVNISVLQAVTCLESVAAKRYAQSCYRSCLGLSDAHLCPWLDACRVMNWVGRKHEGSSDCVVTW